MLPFLGNELLTGDLVRLIRPSGVDIEAFAGWSYDVEYSRLLRRGMIYPNSAESTAEWFAEMEKQDDIIPFAVKTLAGDQMVGMLVINHIMWQARHCTFFIGIGEAENRGKGYGSDAVRVMLKYIFLEMNLNRVGLDVMSYNPHAVHTYEKLGFKLEGTQRAMVYRDGVYYDMHMMGILRAEWEALYGYPPIRYPSES